MNPFSKNTLGLCVVLSATLAAQAQVHFYVSVDTSSLVGNASGPFSLDFQLNQGDGSVVNTATIGNFWYSGGHAVGSPTLVGGATGSLATGFSLSTSSFLNEAYQQFSPGSKLGFDVTLSTLDEPTTPDSFSFSILDGSSSNIPTTGLGDSLLQGDISHTLTFPAVTVSSGTGSYATLTLVTTPEPATTGLIVASALGLAAVFIRRSRRA